MSLITSRIPTEILENIFLHAIDGPISNIQDKSFPWALERVCKYWRSAFLTYPHLWTWITINLAEAISRRQNLSAVNRGLSLCLERSRNCPLNISLHLPAKKNEKNTPSRTLIWKTFMSCSHRWRIIHLSNVHELQLVALNSCTGATPILESLTIHSRMDIGHVGFTGFQIAPHLTRFTLRDPSAMFAARKWSVPWMKLTNLVLRFEEIAGVHQLCTLFKHLQDIEELRLVLEGDSPGVDLGDFVPNSETLTPRCLQHLRVLQVCCIEIFGLITAPSLSELCLEHSELFYPSEFFYPVTGDSVSYEVVVAEILSGFIQRSSCKIQKLTLSDFSEHLFTPLVQLFPDVVELCLADAKMCLRHLLSPNHFPGLRVLDCIDHMIDVEHFMGTLLEILELRNSSSARCSAVPLTKVIYRPVIEDEESSVLVTTTDWASFQSSVRVASCCELNIPGNLLLPGKRMPTPPPTVDEHRSLTVVINTGLTAEPRSDR